MMIRSALVAVMALASTTAHAIDQKRAQEIATSIYGSSGVKSLVTPAKVLRFSTADGEDPAVLIGEPDCNNNPRPYGQPKKDFCAVEIRAAYGWYADPGLVVNVKAFISKGKIAGGALTSSDVILRSVNIEIPDPSGLE